MTDCPCCAAYDAYTAAAIDDAGRAHRAALAAIRRDERDSQVPGPDRWLGGWSADAFHYVAPDPTRGQGRG